jgi:hypothetical protein
MMRWERPRLRAGLGHDGKDTQDWLLANKRPPREGQMSQPSKRLTERSNLDAHEEDDETCLFCLEPGILPYLICTRDHSYKRQYT